MNKWEELDFDTRVRIREYEDRQAAIGQLAMMNQLGIPQCIKAVGKAKPLPITAYDDIKTKMIDATFDRKLTRDQYFYLDDYMRDMRYRAEKGEFPPL